MKSRTLRDAIRTPQIKKKIVTEVLLYGRCSFSLNAISNLSCNIIASGCVRVYIKEIMAENNGALTWLSKVTASLAMCILYSSPFSDLGTKACFES